MLLPQAWRQIFRVESFTFFAEVEMAGTFPEHTSKILAALAILIWLAAFFNVFAGQAGKANMAAVLLLLIAGLLSRRRQQIASP